MSGSVDSDTGGAANTKVSGGRGFSDPNYVHHDVVTLETGGSFILASISKKEDACVESVDEIFDEAILMAKDAKGSISFLSSNMAVDCN